QVSQGSAVAISGAYLLSNYHVIDGQDIVFMGLRGIEWVILGQDTAESCAFPSYFALPLGFESTMNVGWHEQRSEGGGCGVHIRSPVFDRNRQCAAFSVIRKRV